MCHKSPTVQEQKAIISIHCNRWIKRLAISLTPIYLITNYLFQGNNIQYTTTYGPIYIHFGVYFPNDFSFNAIAMILFNIFGCLLISLILGSAIGETIARIKLRRIRKGLCINCKYDLRMHDNQCPECGEFQSVLYKKLQY